MEISTSEKETKTKWCISSSSFPPNNKTTAEWLEEMPSEAEFIKKIMIPAKSISDLVDQSIGQNDEQVHRISPAS